MFPQSLPVDAERLEAKAAYILANLKKWERKRGRLSAELNQAARVHALTLLAEMDVPPAVMMLFDYLVSGKSGSTLAREREKRRRIAALHKTMVYDAQHPDETLTGLAHVWASEMGSISDPSDYRKQLRLYRKASAWQAMVKEIRGHAGTAAGS
jgi:hypothetical protein